MAPPVESRKKEKKVFFRFLLLPAAAFSWKKIWSLSLQLLVDDGPSGTVGVPFLNFDLWQPVGRSVGFTAMALTGKRKTTVSNFKMHIVRLFLSLTFGIRRHLKLNNQIIHQIICSGKMRKS